MAYAKSPLSRKWKHQSVRPQPQITQPLQALALARHEQADPQIMLKVQGECLAFDAQIPIALIQPVGLYGPFAFQTVLQRFGDGGEQLPVGRFRSLYFHKGSSIG